MAALRRRGRGRDEWRVGSRRGRGRFRDESVSKETRSSGGRPGAAVDVSYTAHHGPTMAVKRRPIGRGKFNDSISKKEDAVQEGDV